MEGKVKFYNFRKGWGFIIGEDEQEYFVHFSSVPKDVILKENMEVTFDGEESTKGKQAKNITIKQQ